VQLPVRQARGNAQPNESEGEADTMVDFATQRLNMVESQVRPSDVTDRRIMTAMRKIAREAFLPESARSIAYADTDLRISIAGEGGGKATTHLIAPRVFARMLQALDLGTSDIVLDIGCGTGYGTAVLASIAQTVVAIEADPLLVAFATRNLEAAEIHNAAVVQKPLTEGYDPEGPYDAILVNGMVDHVPDMLLDQLKDGGRLVAVLNNGRLGEATQWRRLGGSFDKVWLFDAAAPKLEAFSTPAAFAF
jgi:protein-L-isoaspartate(D-aspartate) O-methyltransferase